MATTYPLPTLAATVTAAGISAPTYSDILASLHASAQAIFGVDIYLQPDSQDGQLLAIFARAIHDANQTAIAVYNSFSPSTAQGAALSSAVRINGLTRLVASNSQAALLLGGTVGTVITNGAVSDAAGNLWKLPASVTIPISGSISVTATCATAGAVAAWPGTLTQIATPTSGWATATNPAAADTGAPVETDAALRVRQAASVALPALTPLAATVAAVEALTGVVQVAPYENPTGGVDANGLPAHSISLVVEGGDLGQIAAAIASKKTPGCATYGTTSETVIDSVGVPHTINFFVPTAIPIVATVTIHALSGYTSAVASAIQSAVSAYINSLPIGQSVFLARLYLPAQLFGGTGSGTFELVSVTIAASPASPTAADVAIAFNAMATCVPASVTVTVV